MLSILIPCIFIASLRAHDLQINPESIKPLLKSSPIPLNSPISMFLQPRDHLTYEANLQAGLNCTDFDIQNPNNPLMSYLTYSGRSINDFGFFDSCKSLKKNQTLMAMSPPFYVIFGINITSYTAKWGVCMPLYCFSQIYTTLNTTISQSLNSTLQTINGNYMDDYDLSDWTSVLMICILAFFFLLGLVGSLIENTTIGDRYQHKDEPLLDSQSNPSHVITNLQSTVNINGTEVNRTMQRSQASSAAPSIIPPPRPQITDPFERKSGWAKFLMCFSISSNMKKFVTRGREPSPLDVFDGVRVLSIFWVILGHSYFYPIMQGNSIRNTPDLLKFLKQFLFTMIPSGFLAVDTFFFMSAFLGAYIFLVKSPKQFTSRMLVQVPIAYFHRYYRLTPLLAFIIYFGAFVIYPLGSGPIGNFTSYSRSNCYHYGWADLLYINNFYPKGEKVCEGQTWYLANDMQLFLILPWLMIFYRINKLIGFIVLSACLAANLAVSFYIAWHYKMGLGLVQPDNFFKDFYEVPWVRATPYLVGIFAGIFYYEYKQELKRVKQQSNSEIYIYRGSIMYQMFDIATRSTFMSLIYFIVGFGITFTCVFVVYPFQKQGFNINAWGLGARSTYNMLARGMFVLGLFLLLIPLLAGRFPMLREFLGNSLFHVMAKSTYSVYLIHEMFLIVFGFSERSYKYFTHIDGFVIALSMIVLSYLVGSVFTLLIDSPLANIDKTFIFPPKKKKTSPPLKTLS